MITYNIECPTGLYPAAVGYLIACKIIPPSAPPDRVQLIEGTLVFSTTFRKPESIKQLCLFLGQECAAWIDGCTGEHGFSGPSPWPTQRWYAAKFSTLPKAQPPRPAPTGNLAAVMVIPFGNDTPVQYCLWDTDTGMYLASSRGQPLVAIRSACEMCLSTLRNPQYTGTVYWTNTRPTAV